jgi:hypothetical protein
VALGEHRHKKGVVRGGGGRDGRAWAICSLRRRDGSLKG